MCRTTYISENKGQYSALDKGFNDYEYETISSSTVCIKFGKPAVAVVSLILFRLLCPFLQTSYDI